MTGPDPSAETARDAGPPAYRGRPLVVGVVPDQPQAVALHATALARALGAEAIFGYVDPTRQVDEEFPDGTVRSSPLEPDVGDDGWERTRDEIEGNLAGTLEGLHANWSFRYLAGNPQRALADLARAVGASMIVVGTREPGIRPRLREFIDGSVSVQLAHRQPLPVLTVPLRPVDWKAPAPWE